MQLTGNIEEEEEELHQSSQMRLIRRNTNTRSYVEVVIKCKTLPRWFAYVTGYQTAPPSQMWISNLESFFFGSLHLFQPPRAALCSAMSATSN
jgi:hypothetical protein